MREIYSCDYNKNRITQRVRYDRPLNILIFGWVYEVVWDTPAYLNSLTFPSPIQLWMWSIRNIDLYDCYIYVLYCIYSFKSKSNKFNCWDMRWYHFYFWFMVIFHLNCAEDHRRSRGVNGNVTFQSLNLLANLKPFARWSYRETINNTTDIIVNGYWLWAVFVLRIRHVERRELASICCHIPFAFFSSSADGP